MPNGMVISIQGLRGTWKSSLALSVPGEKFVFDLEYGLHRARGVEALTPDRIMRMPIDLAGLTRFKGELVVGQSERWNELMKQYGSLLIGAGVVAQTIVFDTWKEAWTLNCQAFLQDKQQTQLAEFRRKFPMNQEDDAALSRTIQGFRQSLMPVEYSLPGSRMDAIITLAKQFNKTLVLISHQRDKYVGDKPTGELELDGYKKTEDLADWCFTTFTKLVDQRRMPHVRIEKNPLDDKFQGLEIPNPTWERICKVVGVQL